MKLHLTRNLDSDSEKMLLNVDNLNMYFYTSWGIVKAVNGVSLQIGKNEVVGLVGESGCGKSMTAFTIMRVIPHPGRIVGGKIIYKEKNLLDLSEKDMETYRGREISMVFQDPLTYLNPIMKVKDQIAEVIQLNEGIDKKESRRKSVDMLKEVFIPSPSQTAEYYPHQLSGGMQQRILIAMALSCNPSLLIADEPTTALDVTVQAQILKLLKEIKNKKGLSILLITHNLGIVADICDRIYVMYAGEICEWGDCFQIFDRPRHPYTVGLIKSVLRIDEIKRVFVTIPGTLPDLSQTFKGCKFYPRCSAARPICSEQNPQKVEVNQGHFVRCWLY